MWLPLLNYLCTNILLVGNYSLARILPKIYGVNQEYMKNHIMTLVSILPNCDDSEKISLITMFASVAKENPSVSILHFKIQKYMQK